MVRVVDDIDNDVDWSEIPQGGIQKDAWVNEKVVFARNTSFTAPKRPCGGRIWVASTVSPSPMRPVGALCVTEMDVVGCKKCAINRHFVHLVAPIGLIFSTSKIPCYANVAPLGLRKCRPYQCFTVRICSCDRQVTPVAGWPLEP